MLPAGLLSVIFAGFTVFSGFAAAPFMPEAPRNMAADSLPESESLPASSAPIINISEAPAQQIRMEQTAVIRVPRSKGAVSNNVMNEEKIGNCLATGKIKAMRVSSDSSIDLMTSNGHLIRAYMDKGCEAREFYSGFYIEKPADGLMCAGREMLYSRSGSICQVSHYRLLGD